VTWTKVLHVKRGHSRHLLNFHGLGKTICGLLKRGPTANPTKLAKPQLTVILRAESVGAMENLEDSVMALFLWKNHCKNAPMNKNGPTTH